MSTRPPASSDFGGPFGKASHEIRVGFSGRRGFWGDVNVVEHRLVGWDVADHTMRNPKRSWNVEILGRLEGERERRRVKTQKLHLETQKGSQPIRSSHEEGNEPNPTHWDNLNQIKPSVIIKITCFQAS